MNAPTIPVIGTHDFVVGRRYTARQVMFFAACCAVGGSFVITGVAGAIGVISDVRKDIADERQ